MAVSLKRQLREYQTLIQQASIVHIALSGGLDSSVLLHSLCTSNIIAVSKINVIHVHHGLLSIADAWAAHCQKICDQLGVTLHIEWINSKPGQGESLEAWARHQRYAIFEQHLQSNDILLMAHHADDQVETVLLNLLRGAGPKGLSGMPVIRNLGQGQLLRPLLVLSREQLQQYAKQHQLDWMDDPSNQDIRFDRNFIRQQLMPLLKTRWPQADKCLNQAAQHCRAEHHIVERWSYQQLDKVLLDHDIVNLMLLKIYPKVEQHLIIRTWLSQLGQKPPSWQWLQQLQTDVIEAKEDAEPVLILEKGEIHRFQHKLYWLSEPVKSIKPYNIKWDGMVPLLVPGWPDPLTKDGLIEQGLDTDSLDWRHISVRSRQGGERCKPKGWQHSQTLKKCFPIFNIPPWERDRMPLVYCKQHLILVFSGWLCQ